MPSKKPFPSHNAERFVARFPTGMRERLKEHAQRNRRPLNSEIVARLEWTFGEECRLAERQVAADAPSFNIRFPAGMRAHLHALAAEHGWSVNSEIVGRLEWSLRHYANGVGPSLPVASLGEGESVYPHEKVFDLVAKLSPKKRRALETLLDDTA